MAPQVEKMVQGSGKRGLKSGNNEIVNPKEREMPKTRQKKQDREQNMFRRRCDLADLRSKSR